ncbi:MAG: hydrogenase maturation protease [Gemmataceae bacterium]
MTWPLPIRVIGVGSSQGDDALAWAVTSTARSAQTWGPEIEFHVVEGGQRLLDILDGTGTLLLIDALAPGGSPGAIHRFEWPDRRVDVLRPGSTHDLRPAEALKLAETLGTLPPYVAIFGIEAAAVYPSREFSPAIATAIPELARRIVTELNAYGPSSARNTAKEAPDARNVATARAFGSD